MANRPDKYPMNKTIHKIYLLLDNIRSVHNVGSIFRTADGAGVSKIYCVETTPVPVDRFGRKRRDFAKVSLGAEQTVGWEHLGEGEVVKTIRKLKKEGFVVIAVEQDEDSVGLTELQTEKIAKKNILYIFGNEVGGVSPEIMKLADMIVEIPMNGTKESLNVSVTAGIILFR